MKPGNFTLPGEAGYEALTLSLAKRWGADVIRDSDGTKLSPEILEAGYGIYSTLCIIRDHNAWIAAHPDARQQCFLCSAPVVAPSAQLCIRPMDGFFAEQFAINDGEDAFAYWQVYDRTTGELLSRDAWRYDPASGEVCIEATPWHRYTVSFLAWRIWEEISMYNHVTNSWTSEHLMQLDPYHPQARAYLHDWLTAWCESHPQTDVVRFTSLFYNFAWIWGSDPRNRSLFTDWASYDFTVSPGALNDFAKAYGYALTAENFVRGGLYNATHCVPSRQKRDWMEFIGAFVRDAGKAYVDIVHRAGKQAYVFYDDSWVGMEPYNGHFEAFGFDGLIKCVFSGFEVRLCAGVPVRTHELRFHPYLFPTGLGGAPTFSPGGDPARDALTYWVQVRRALLRAKIERAGLGGYLHLTEGYPDFLDTMDTILSEFRAIAALHDAGAPLCLAPRIGILHVWGKLRSWTLSGHFHETDQHVLIHILESLSGLPYDVQFLSFDDVRDGVPEGIDILINAGEAGSAWSGGSCWADEAVVSAITKWVYDGGVLLGVDAPSAAPGQDTLLRMAHVLGVDLDTGDRSCHGRWPVEAQPMPGLVPEDMAFPVKESLYLTDGKACVLATQGGKAVLTVNPFGKGKGIYLTGYKTGTASTRFLQNLLSFAATGALQTECMPENAYTECAIFPGAGQLVLVNNDARPQTAACTYKGKRYAAELAPYAMRMLPL